MSNDDRNHWCRNCGATYYSDTVPKECRYCDVDAGFKSQSNLDRFISQMNSDPIARTIRGVGVAIIISVSIAFSVFGLIIFIYNVLTLLE